MPNILFLCLHRPNRSPSQRYRFEQYISFLESAGFTTRISFLLGPQADIIFYKQGKVLGKLLILIRSFWIRSKEVFIDKPADIVFVQRECFMLGTAFFEKQFSKRSKLIFDFDDSIWLNAVSSANKVWAFLKNPKKIDKIIACSDMIICGNRNIAAYAKQYNENVYVIPSTIDTDKYLIKNHDNSSTIVIGWSGSFSTIPHFEIILPCLSQIKSRYGDRVKFLVIGVNQYAINNLPIDSIPWNAETEVSDLHRIDIGIMPLPDDEWTRGKCGMKGLQYMAAGIPAILSPVGMNTEIIQDGENGFLASSQLEWIDKLSLLIESVELRRKLGSNGRKTVEEKYSVKANAPLYLELFNSLIAR